MSQNSCCEEQGSSAKVLRHRVVIASLIETAKFNGIEQFQCLRNTLETMVLGFSASRIDELLPVR
ncbi:MAG: transposase domain-containing protein [Acetobacter aceti]|uniref:transposase domain-containing protein n=1 Tax=Acetobacteraceae TaxID=433 RepID=UPI0016569CB1|nr:transposase domain-containing protein [Acetobacter aceti]